jgi:hypothetical protein
VNGFSQSLIPNCEKCARTREEKEEKKKFSLVALFFASKKLKWDDKRDDARWWQWEVQQQ